MGAPGRIPSDPAISRHDAPSGVRRRILREHDTPTKSMETGFWQILILARGGTQGPHPLFMLIQQSPHHRLAPGDQSKRTDLRPRRSCGSPISGPRNEPRRCNAAAAAKSCRAPPPPSISVSFSALLRASPPWNAANSAILLEITPPPHLCGSCCPAAQAPP
jgi:hypothetical protein